MTATFDLNSFLTQGSGKPVYCRLSVILAREALVAVIFRRGPSKWTHVIKWHTDSDTFEYGAWFHGSFYPDRCDLSPDGTKLIYFAGYSPSYSLGKGEGDFPNEWTAISKPPWLTTLALWDNRGTYYGGGLFETNTRIWLSSLGESFVSKSAHLPGGLEVSYDHPFWDHNWHLLFRLERDGWKAIQKYPLKIVCMNGTQNGIYGWEDCDPNALQLNDGRTIHEKAQTAGARSLIMTSIYGSYYKGKDSRIFEIQDNERKFTIPIEGAVWADWDQRGRLVYAKEGKLFTAAVNEKGEFLPTELADFNSLKPMRTKSPQWARVW